MASRKSSPSEDTFPGLLRSLAPRKIIEEVRHRFGDFIEKRINPGVAERDRLAEPFSKALLHEMGDLGLFGFTAPKEVGGEGRSWRDWGYVLHEIGYRSRDTALPMLLAYCGTITKVLYESGRRDLIERYARPMARGRCLGGFGWSEGRDPYSFATTARKTEDGYLLNGQKLPIADGQVGDVFLIFARETDTNDNLCLLVERTDRGVEITPYNAMGLRAVGMARVQFKDVRLPAGRILWGADALSLGQRFLNDRRLEMSCWALGKMRRLFEDCAHELAHRIRFKLPLTEMQAVQAVVGKMHVALESSRLVTEAMLEHVDRDSFDPLWDPQLAVCKCVVIEQALQMCRWVQDITGGAGVFEEKPYERCIRDLQCLNPVAGTLSTLQVDLGILAIHDVERRWKKEQGGNA